MRAVSVNRNGGRVEWGEGAEKSEEGDWEERREGETVA